MLKVTTRDRVFAAAALPAAAIAAYIHFARAPLTARIEAMEGRLAELGEAGDAIARRPALERRRREAKAQLEAAEADAAAQDATAVADASARLRAFTSLVEACGGTKVVSCEFVDEADGGATVLLREATGIENPTLWRFSLVADYPSLMRLLGELSSRKANVIVEQISSREAPGVTAARVWSVSARL